MTFNTEIESLQPSRSIAFMAKAKQLRAQDPDILDFSGGEPDFDTPKAIRDELFKWVNLGYTHYTVGPGLPELREGIAEKLRKENGCNYSADGIIVTPGAKFAIYIAVRSLVNPGDEVIYLEPGWVSYPAIIQSSGAKPVAVALDGRDNFKLTFDALERACTARTKMLIINYPCNPTGRVLTAQEAAEVKRFMLAHPDVMLLSDEVYERITYTGSVNVSPASDGELTDRVITVNGFSKSVAMTGWRVGYLAAAVPVKNVINKLFQHSLTCVSGFIQKASVAALGCGKEIEEMRREYQRRRDFFIPALNAIPGVKCHCPEGAFYAWVRFDINGMDAEQVGSLLLQKAKVVAVPGNAYGTDEPYVRFSFASPYENLVEAAARIAKVVAGERRV